MWEETARQLAFLIITPYRVVQVELKKIGGRVVNGPKNGPWKVEVGGRTVRELGNPVRQALETTHALSDELLWFAQRTTVPAPRGGKFYFDIDTVVCAFPSLPHRSHIDGHPHVTVLGYEELLNVLGRPGPSLQWSPEQWDAFCRKLNLYRDEEDSPEGIMRRAGAAVVDEYIGRYLQAHSDLGPLVPTGVRVDGHPAERPGLADELPRGRAMLLHGPSGSGKTLWASHAATTLAQAGHVPIWLTAGSCDESFRTSTARAIAPLTAVSPTELLRAADEAGRGVVFVLDDLTRTSDAVRLALINGAQTARVRNPTRGVLITAQTPACAPSPAPPPVLDGHTRDRRAKRGVVIARGFGIKVRVDRAHLVIEDGTGADRCTRRFHRAAGKLRRLVVIGHTGYVTLDALRWLYDIGATLVHIDADGRLLTTSTMAGASVPTLRRAQAMAPATSAGIEAARDLLRVKVSEQASLLPFLPGGEDVTPEVECGLADIEEAQDIPGLLAGELRAAGAYWQAWEALPVAIAPRRGARHDSVPDHWRSFGARTSLLSGSPRSATNPANALLNYLYALLSAEAVFACHEIGLDPGLGIFHMDRDHDSARTALAFDVMEACRPTVDAYVLALINERTLSMDQLGETPQGACRLALALTAELAGTLPFWREQVAPHAERMAHTLQAATSTDLAALATPLTHANLIAALDKQPPHRKRRRAPARATIPRTCEHCGAPIKNRRSRNCGTCAHERTKTQRAADESRAARLLDEIRTRQGATGKPVSEHGVQVAAHHRAAREWSGERRPPWEFSPIREALEGIPVVAMAAATELSEIYCQAIRSGRATPHPRHWEALAVLAGRERVAGGRTRRDGEPQKST